MNSVAKYGLLVLGLMASTACAARVQQPGMDWIKTSQAFLYAVRTGDSSEALVQQLAGGDANELSNQLPTDAQKKAFWLNIYNAFLQKLLTQNPDRYKSRNAFFSRKQIIIAGKKLSLDDVEHGMLRRSKIKWSFGHLNKPFPSSFEKRFRVDSLDSRIHFALNCGAKSCPPIAYYTAERIDKELDLAARSYLSGEAAYNKAANTIALPRTMSWFRADFGGKKGMRKLLTRYSITPQNISPTIRFQTYDWELFLANYTPEQSGR